MAPKDPKLSHVDAAGRPRMVDVSAKRTSARQAVAICDVVFPLAVAAQLRAADMRGKKGSVIDAAIIAGVMAAKRTHELIPFCHPLPIERCDLSLQFVDEATLRIECRTAVSGKTGVEMEALVGATLAGLTVYDMTKALSHRIEIRSVRLLEKRGGKRGLVRGAQR